LKQSEQRSYNKAERRVTEMGTGREYDEEIKKQAVKLAMEVGNKTAAEEVGIPKGTLGT